MNESWKPSPEILASEEKAATTTTPQKHRRGMNHGNLPSKFWQVRKKQPPPPHHHHHQIAHIKLKLLSSPFPPSTPCSLNKLIFFYPFERSGKTTRVNGSDKLKNKMKKCLLSVSSSLTDDRVWWSVHGQVCTEHACVYMGICVCVLAGPSEQPHMYTENRSTFNFSFCSLCVCIIMCLCVCVWVCVCLCDQRFYCVNFLWQQKFILHLLNCQNVICHTGFLIFFIMIQSICILRFCLFRYLSLWTKKYFYNVFFKLHLNQWREAIAFQLMSHVIGNTTQPWTG